MDHYQKYICLVCGFIFDEALGIPELGIKSGTKWVDLKHNWRCPECGVEKTDFQKINHES